MESTGIEIKVERIRKGLKQIEVADQTGVSQSTISRIENGIVSESNEDISTLQRFLGLR